MHCNTDTFLTYTCINSLFIITIYYENQPIRVLIVVPMDRGIHILIYVYICAYRFIYLCICIFICECISIFRFAHVYMYIYIHMCVSCACSSVFMRAPQVITCCVRFTYVLGHSCWEVVIRFHTCQQVSVFFVYVLKCCFICFPMCKVLLFFIWFMCLLVCFSYVFPLCSHVLLCCS